MSGISNFFKGLGGGLKSAVGTIGSGLSSVAKPILSTAGSLAPMAGTVFGGMYGGPMGAMAGGQLGNMMSSYINQGNAAPQSQLGNEIGKYIQGYAPNVNNMTFGQAGNQFSGFLDRNLPGTSGYFNNMMSMVPQSYLGSRIFDYMNGGQQLPAPSASGAGGQTAPMPGMTGQSPQTGGYAQPQTQGVPAVENPAWYQGKLEPGMMGAFAHGGSVYNPYYR